MSSYSTLAEAWGTDTLNNQKRNKKRRVPREHYQNYSNNVEEPEIPQGTKILNNRKHRSKKYRKKRSLKQSQHLTSNRDPSTRRFQSQSSDQTRNKYVEPIKIKLEEEDLNEFDYDGYNSSDYEQYELEPDFEHDNAKYHKKIRSPKRRKYTGDSSVMRDDDCPYEEEMNEQEYEDEPSYYDRSEDKHDSMDYQTLDSNTIHRLYMILDKLENDNIGGENIYDVLLFLFFGVFILFIIDYMYKIGVQTNLNL